VQKERETEACRRKGRSTSRLKKKLDSTTFIGGKGRSKRKEGPVQLSVEGNTSHSGEKNRG